MGGGGWSEAGAELVSKVRGGAVLGFQAWDVFPSRSGGREIVDCRVHARADGGFRAECEVMPAEFGQQAEQWTEWWSEVDLLRKVDAVRGSERPYCFWA